MSRQNLIQFRDSALKGELEAFCALTNREPGPTLRALVRLFLADGVEIAELRLTQNLWEAEEATLDESARTAGYRAGREAACRALVAGRARRGRQPDSQDDTSAEGHQSGG